MSDNKSMVVKKSWNEFRKDGLLWWINTILHMFGWAIVLDGEKDENGEFVATGAYPARVRFRGFDEESNTNGYRNVTNYLVEHVNELKEEADE